MKNKQLLAILEKKQAEQESEQLSKQSVEFWRKQMNAVLKKCDEVDAKASQDPDYDYAKNLLTAINELERLVYKGDHELLTLDKLQKQAKETDKQLKQVLADELNSKSASTKRSPAKPRKKKA